MSQTLLMAIALRGPNYLTTDNPALFEVVHIEA
jgi:hypothetical protein